MQGALKIDLYREALIRLLFPSLCGVCEILLTLDEKSVCKKCRRSLEVLAFRPGERALQTPSGPLDEAWALYPYEGPVRGLLSKVKFGRERWLLSFFTEEVLPWAAALQAENGYDALVPIPMTRLAVMRRQFNQSGVLAEALSQKTGLPVRHWLRKRFGAKTQSRLSRFGRLQNTQRRFKVPARADLKNKRILLIDDILTTGATAETAARALKEKGAAKVDILTAAFTQKSES